MAKKGKTTLKELFNDRLVYTKVRTLLEDSESYSTIMKFLHKNGYELSRGSISNLKHKIETSQTTGVPMENLIDKRRKTNVTNLANVAGFTEKDLEQDKSKDIVKGEVSSRPTLNAQTEFFSSEQVLDSIIDKGVRTLNSAEYIDTGVLMKAIDLKAKYFAKDSKGLSIDTLQQYQVITNAKLSAIQQVVMEFIPEDQQEQAFKKMDEAEQNILNNIELQDGGKDLLEALKKAGLDLS